MRRLIAATIYVIAIVFMFLLLQPSIGNGAVSRDLTKAFICIHHYEGAWNANTGNGYYGGLQMDMGFQKRYGKAYLKLYGTADKWPWYVQISVAIAGYSERGFYPWPSTARTCGLL